MANKRVDCKVVMLGKEYGGKTCLQERFLNNTFKDTPYQNTIGAAFGEKRVESNGKFVSLGVWDTAGSERYQAMSRIYYRGAKAAIVCYDVTDKSGFEKAKFWIRELLENEEACKIYLTGTKLDLVENEEKVKEVDFHDAADYAEEIHAALIETSSKTNYNVQKLFQMIADDFAEDPNNAAMLKDVPSEQTVDLSRHQAPSRKKCCRSSS